MDAEIKSRLMSLPQVNALLKSPELNDLVSDYSHELIKHLCQEAISERRQQILAGSAAMVDAHDLIAAVKLRLASVLQPRLKRVINCTGILLHTGLGRAPLLDEAYLRAFQRARAACDLELDLGTGERGDRQTKVEDLLYFLTGAPAAAIVNNNAAAVLLALNTLAYRKETIVARGQLIEIGGSFRLPEVMRKSGTRLIEVGTTNRTYLSDYELAIGAKTGAVLLAHTSNYRIRGFVHEVEIGDLAGLCRQRGVPLIHDLGGGVILDLKKWHLPYEPMAAESIAAGCQVVTFSADKILGGPQAGILVGEAEIIKRIRKNPLMRALRPDKLTLALLEETLKLYLSPGKLLTRHPVLARLAEPPEAAMERARAVYRLLSGQGIPERAKVEVVSAKAQLGSGALPLEEFPSAALRISIRGVAAERLAEKLRCADPPVIGYVRKGGVYVDIKAVADEEVELLTAALCTCLKIP